MSVSVSVVGCGYWGQNLVRNFFQIKQAELQSVCDASPARIKYLEEYYPTVRATQRFEDLLEDPDLDALVIALAAADHYPFAKRSLEAGKHTFVEKPLATTSAQAEELTRLAEERSLVLMVGHTFLYNSAVRKVKEYIQDGLLGEIYYIYAQRLNLGRVRQDINAMWNLAPHDISIILYWLEQDPRWVSARGISVLQPKIEDVVFLDVGFDGDVLAHIHTSWLDPSKTRKITIVGSKKMIVYDDASGDAKVQIFDKGIDRKNIGDNLGEFDTFGKFQLIHRAGDLLIPKIDFKEPLRTECEHFVDCIKNGNTPVSDGRDGTRTVRILEAGQQSLADNGKVIEL